MQCTAGAGSLHALDAEAATDFDSIVRLYWPKVFRFLFASLRDRDTAENLTQDCFLNAFRAYKNFRNDCSLSTWLMQVAVNVLRDHAKSRRLQFWKRLRQTAKPLTGDLTDTLTDSQKSPEAQAVLKEQVSAIWDAAAGLSQRQQTVFLLRFVEDMDVPEIAIATGMTQATTKTHLFRAVQSIRERLGASA